jgi:hypothetical protein
MQFVFRNSYLNRFQTGFHSAHSTKTTLLNVTVFLCLDLSKVFDSGIHDLLCNKLSPSILILLLFNPTLATDFIAFLAGTNSPVLFESKN